MRTGWVVGILGGTPSGDLNYMCGLLIRSFVRKILIGFPSQIPYVGWGIGEQGGYWGTLERAQNG